jgi:DNA-directed RNA polymerase subunit F
MPGKEKLNNVRQAAMDALKDSNQKPSAGADMPPPPMVVKFDPIANAAKGIDPYFNNSGQLEAKRNVQDTIHELIKSIDHAQRVQKLNDEMKNFTVGTISLVAEISDVVSNYASAWTDIQQDLKLLADKVSSTRSEDSIKTIRQLTRNEMSKLFDTFQDSLNKLTKVLPGDNNSLRGRLSQSQNDLRKIMDLADGYFRDMSGTPAPQAPPQKQNR